MSANRIARLVFAIIVCQLAGVVGSIATYPSIPTWYASLQKPFFTPPNWLFAPVWLTLFTLMGISAYLVWSKGLKNRRVKTALMIFAVQLVLNALWSFLFFGLHYLLYAFIEIVILWIAIAFTILTFYRISRPAGIILLPYIVWVSIAATLNYYVWLLNP
jgi:benzodiazapine receptor